MPFDSNTFDIIICENILSFLEDKEKALREFVRVTKNNGYVGILEGVWIKMPPKKIKEKLTKAFNIIYKMKVPELLANERWHKIFFQNKFKEIKIVNFKLKPDFIDWIKELKEDGLSKIYFWLKILWLSTINSNMRKRLFQLTDEYVREVYGEIKQYSGYIICAGKVSK